MHPSRPQVVLGRGVEERRVHQHRRREVDDPTDVAGALAIASWRNPYRRTCASRRGGLGGELRPVMQSERRIAEAATMGFRRVPLEATRVHGEARRRTGGVVRVRRWRTRFRRRWTHRRGTRHGRTGRGRQVRARRRAGVGVPRRFAVEIFIRHKGKQAERRRCDALSGSSTWRVVHDCTYLTP